MFDHVITIGKTEDETIRKMLDGVTNDQAYMDKLVYMSEGNPGAVTVIRALHTVDISRAALSLGKCMAWNIKGPMLWLLFKDVNKQDPEAMLKMIEMDEAQDALEKLSYAHYERPKR